MTTMALPRALLVQVLAACAWIPGSSARAQDTGSLTFVLSGPAELRVVDPQGRGIWRGEYGCDSEGRVLLPKLMQGENLDIRAADGALLSRTPIVNPPWTEEILLGPRRRMGERCFYEIWIERAGLRISRWDLP